MKSGDQPRSLGGRQEQRGFRPYVAPAVRQMSPQETKELLLRSRDVSDPVVQQMLDRIDKILTRGASQ
jgi:hypothetical protein